MHLNDLDYEIPKELIALHPVKPRDNSKLVVVGKNNRIIKFNEIINELNSSDAIIINNTKVIHAELEGTIDNQKVSINLNKIKDKKENTWSTFLKAKKKLMTGMKISIFKKQFAEIIKIHDYEISLKFDLPYKEFLEKIKIFGKPPIPPYIKKRGHKKSDFNNYQTIFAKNEGAVAAPTASFHFTKRLINKLKTKKIKIIYITLHVNGGTFIPIRTANVFKHKMHYEYGCISKESSDEINKVKNNGGRIIAIGTTVLRLLESSKDSKGYISPYKGETNIFIKPGWEINSVDGLVTNFHTPKSTLLLLIFTLIGKKKTMRLYDFAIKNKLRFFSYGDACLIWNKNGKV